MPDALAKTMLFTGIADETRKTLDAAERHRVFAPGEIIFRQGDPATSLVLVVSGLAKVWRATGDGTPITLALLGIGEPIGTLHTAREMPLTASVSAHVRMEVIVWPLPLVRDMMVRDPAFSATIMNVVARHAVRMTERVEEMATAPVEQRVARALCRSIGIASLAKEVTDLPLSRQDVADMSAATLPSVSRIMARWREAGLIAGRRGHIHLLDCDRLHAIAGLPRPGGA